MGAIRRIKVSRPKISTVKFGKMYSTDLSVEGSIGGFNRAYRCYNFRVKDGSLKSEDGAISLADKYVLPSGVKPISLYYYKRNDYTLGVNDDRLLVYCSNKKTYECPMTGGNFTLVSGLEYDNQPIGVCYNYNSKDVIIFSTVAGGMRIYDGETVQVVKEAPAITSMCISNERLFITSDGVDGALWFSDDFDPSNWNVSLSEAGFIDMSDKRGDMVCVVAFADCVYVFRDYGVSKVIAYADQAEFLVSHLLTSFGKIKKGSVTPCGDRILFMATDGVYSFDGLTAIKISEAWDEGIDYNSKFVKGVYYNGYAYFLMSLKGEGGSGTGILKVSPTGDEYSFLTVEKVSDLTVIDGKDEYLLMGVDNTFTSKIFKFGNSGTFNGIETIKKWQSKPTDFGIRCKRKLLKEISFYAKGNIHVSVRADDRRDIYFTCSKKEGWRVVKPNVSAERFIIELFSPSEEVEISGFTMKFSYYDE